MDGHRDFKTTLIYADDAPAANEADLVNAAFSFVSTNLSTNLSKSGGNSEQEAPANRGRASSKHPSSAGVVQAVVGSSPLAHPSSKSAISRDVSRLLLFGAAVTRLVVPVRRTTPGLLHDGKRPARVSGAR